MASAGHQIHREKPLGQIRPRLLKHRADARVNVMAAVLAGIGPALCDPMELAVGTACWASELSAAVLLFHDPA
jgi:hypothetical protein